MLKDEEDSDAKSSRDSEPEMFDDVQKISDGSEISPTEEDTPIKKPVPQKRKLGPKPTTTKRKIESSESDATPVKKKVKFS